MPEPLTCAVALFLESPVLVSCGLSTLEPPVEHPVATTARHEANVNRAIAVPILDMSKH